jgi:hypothetical protein
MDDCRHPLLCGLELTRCAVHSNDIMAVWTWRQPPLPAARCPCEVADRYLVTSRVAAPGWWSHADVAVLEPQPDLRTALRAAYPAECAVVALPVAGVGTVFRTPTGLVQRQGLCCLCVYPWLVTAARPVRAGPARRGGRRSRCRGAEPA